MVAGYYRVGGGPVVRLNTPPRPAVWTPPGLVNPIVIEYRAAGPYDVTAGVQRADSYVFDGARDLQVTLAAGGVSRSNGVVINGGRNITLMGGVIDVDKDYATLAGLSHGAPDYGLNTKNKALLINKTTDGVVHIEGLRITGAWLYEGIDLRGTTGSHLQLVNCRVDRVQFYSELTPGAQYDHDGGDVIQTQSNWGDIRIDGLWARSAWFQGLFFKQESGRSVGNIDLRNVYLDDYQGAGAAVYVTTPSKLSMSNVFIRPTFTRQNAAGQPRLGSVKTAAKTQYAAGVVTDLGASAGEPTVQVQPVRPGVGYVSPGYVT